MNNKYEVWALLEESNGKYEISSFGRVRRKTQKGYRFRKPFLNRVGQQTVFTRFATKDGKQKSFSLAGLVYKYFGDFSPRKIVRESYVFHKDGDLWNNRIDNLYCKFNRDGALKQWQIDCYVHYAEKNIHQIREAFRKKLREYHINAEDFTQEALIAIWAYLPSLVENESFYNFCRHYAKYAYLQILAKKFKEHTTNFTDMSGMFRKSVGEAYDD